MYKQIAELILYGDVARDSVLYEMGEIFRRFDALPDKDPAAETDLIRQIYHTTKHLLTVATDYGFDRNLWHNYLSYFFIANENPFSITCEKTGAHDGSVNGFAMHDFAQFYELFFYDFAPIEESLGIDCFSRLCDYHAIRKNERMYNQNVSEKVQALSAQLETAQSPEDFFACVTGFYRDFGVGMFGINKAFRIEPAPAGVRFLPINNMDTVRLSDLVGYEIQKKKLIDNTKAFVEGKKANNVLLFGDSGTGKSTSIKAIVNEFYPQGLRMIEIYKHQFKELSNLIAAIKHRNYKFVIYMDDLSFEDFEVEYKFLKAVIEGGVETRPDNILIYATSNRRHLIHESWKDRDDMEKGPGGMHRSDTMQEKLSLVNRFGVTIYYGKPSQKEYFDIVAHLAEREGLKIDEKTLFAEANKWELSHGGISGRTAQQFVNYLAGFTE